MKKLIAHITRIAKCLDTAKKIGALLVLCTTVILWAGKWAKDQIVLEVVSQVTDQNESVAVDLYALQKAEIQKQTIKMGALLTHIMDQQDRDSLRTIHLDDRVSDIENQLTSLHRTMKRDTATADDRRWADLFEILKLQELDRAERIMDKQLEDLYRENRNQVDEFIEGDRGQ